MRGRASLPPLVLALATVVLATPAAARAQATAPGLPTLTTIGAIRALSQDEGARGYPVRVRGIVTHIDEQADVSLIVHDGQLGQFFMPPTDPGRDGGLARAAARRPG